MMEKINHKFAPLQIEDIIEFQISIQRAGWLEGERQGCPFKAQMVNKFASKSSSEINSKQVGVHIQIKSANFRDT